MFKSLHASPYRFLILSAIAVAAIGSVIAIASCSPKPPIAYAPAPASYAPAPQAYAVAPAAAPAPVIIQQAAPAHSGAEDMLVGAAIGSLATHALTSNRQGAAAPVAAPATATTVNKTVIHKTTIVQAAPRAPAPQAKPAWTPTKTADYRAPVGYKATTTTVRFSSPYSSRR